MKLPDIFVCIVSLIAMMLNESQAGASMIAIQDTTRINENTTKISNNDGNIDEDSEIEVICKIMLCIPESEIIYFRPILVIFLMERQIIAQTSAITIPIADIRVIYCECELQDLN